MMKHISVILLMCLFTGCAAILDGMVENTIDVVIDSAIETKEEREIRRDTARWQRGESLQYHPSVEHLRRHRKDIRFQEWEKERHLDRFEEQAARQRQIEKMEQERELYEQIKDIPIDSGLSTVTNSP